MNFLNGIPEAPGKSCCGGCTKKQADFWHKLPEPAETSDIERIEDKITSMRNKYDMYREKNTLLSVIAQMNTLLKAKEDEINRL